MNNNQENQNNQQQINNNQDSYQQSNYNNYQQPVNNNQGNYQQQYYNNQYNGVNNYQQTYYNQGYQQPVNNNQGNYQQQGYNNGQYNSANNYQQTYYNQGYQQPVNYNQGNYQQQYYNNGYYTPKKKKSPVLPIILIILAFVAVFGGISAIKHFRGNNIKVEEAKYNPNRKTDYERAILIYMVGSDLESSGSGATFDLEGLDYNSLEKQKTKVVMIAGGSKKWYNNYVTQSESSIYELTSSGWKKVKQQDLQNMGNSKALTNFLNYSYNNYKAKKYDLMFWNHGLGALGVESDELFDNDYLTLKEMKTSMDESVFSKENKLESIIFSTCLNGTLEVASTLKDYSQYMVASEEVTVSIPYHSSLKGLNKINSGDSSIEVGKKFIDGYFNFIKEAQDEQRSKGNYSSLSSTYSTYSIIDLSKVSALEKSVNEFFKSVDVNSNYNTIARVRGNLLQYGASNGANFYDEVDLYYLVDGLKSLNSSKSQEVLNNLNKAIVYNSASDSRSKGLSIYFPYRGKDAEKDLILKTYEVDELKDYKTFITSFKNYGKKYSSKNLLSFDKNDTSIDVSNNDANFTLKLTDEQKKTFVSAQYIVFRDNKDGTYLPVYRGKNVKQNGNTLTANYKGRQLKIDTDEKDAQDIVTLIESEETDDYIKYQTSVVLENFKDNNFIMDRANAELMLDKKTGKISLGKVLLNSGKEDLPSKSVADLSKYTNIAFGSTSYKILDSKGNYNEKWESNGTYKGLEVKIDDVKFKVEDFNNGYNYYAVFIIWDTYNNHYYSKLVKMK